MEESALSAAINPFYRDRASFGGVDAAYVERAWNDFKAADVRLAAAAGGRSDARVRWLATIEAALDDGDAGVGARLTAFFNAGDALAADPGNTSSRNAMIQRLGEVAGAFRNSAEELARSAAGISDEARTVSVSINDTLTALAKVNLGLRRATLGTSAHAQIQDERDRLIDDLSAKMEIDTSFADDGLVTITLGGATGITLLGPGRTGAVELREAVDGRLSLVTNVDGTPTLIYPTGGTIAGLIETAAAVADRRASLDAVATNFAAQLNDWSAQGIDLNGAPGAAMLSMGATGAASLAVAVTDPALIAAAGADGSANGNLLALTPLRDAGGAEARWAGLVTSQAQALAAAKSENLATSARRDGAFASRDESAGIDLDYEASQLIRFQQAYDGSAKVIQMARDTMQSILDLI